MNSVQNDNENINLKSFIIKGLHHWKLFGGAFIVSLLLAVLYLIYYPTTYEIMASIQLQDDKDLGTSSLALGEASGLMKSFGLGSVAGRTISVDDELAKLTSVDLVRKMVLNLGINVNYLKPKNYKYCMYENHPIVISVDSITNNTLQNIISLDLSINEKGAVELTIKEKKETKHFKYDSLPAEIRWNQNSFIMSYSGQKIVPYKQTIEIVPATWVAEDLIREFVIEEYSKSSNVIELTCQDYEVKRGMDKLNTLIALYNLQESEVKTEAGQKSISFLDGRISDVLNQLSEIEQAIEKYKIKNKMTDLEYDVQFYSEQMKNLQIKIIDVEAQTHLVDLMEEYIKKPENKNSLIPGLFAIGDGEKNSPISSYNEVLLERSRILQTSKSDNPLIETLDKQLNQLRQSVIISIENAKKSINLTLVDLKSKEKAILDKMGDVPILEREFIDYKRQQEVFQAMYLILLQKKEEIALSIGEDKDRARVISAAYVKQNPVAPRKLFAVLGMMFITLLVPIGYLFFKKQIAEFIVEFKKQRK